jgi:hypothetical protein
LLRTERSESKNFGIIYKTTVTETGSVTQG